MPHITIEYSANVAEHHDVQAMVDAVHAAALHNGLPALAGLRTRAMARSHYRIADGQPTHAFVAMVGRIGPGRDSAAKTAFLEDILDACERALASENSPLAIAYSAEITELDADFRINRNHVRSALDQEDH